MILDKPPWVSHKADGKPTSLYGIDVHPDGRRLVTAGMDSKVRVWNMAPVREGAQEAEEAVPKLLATMDQHAASVNTVRFSISGRHIASGSDDTIVLIFELRPGPGRNVLGSKEENLENWQVRVELGHEKMGQVVRTRRRAPRTCSHSVCSPLSHRPLPAVRAPEPRPQRSGRGRELVARRLDARERQPRQLRHRLGRLRAAGRPARRRARCAGRAQSQSPRRARNPVPLSRSVLPAA